MESGGQENTVRDTMKKLELARHEGMVSSLKDQLEAARKELQQLHEDANLKSDELALERHRGTALRKDKLVLDEQVNEMKAATMAFKANLNEKERSSQELYDMVRFRNELVTKLREEIAAQVRSMSNKFPLV
jgi:predicted  nucleic acid-binding Zn-ribbon protein